MSAPSGSDTGAIAVVVHGAGAVGARVARQLLSTPDVHDVVVAEPDEERRAAVLSALGSGARLPDGDPVEERAAVHVLCSPAGEQAPVARRLVDAGVAFVATSDSLEEARALLDLDAEAAERGLSVAIGAGFAPGLTCVLAAHAASTFDAVDEVHVAKVGTGGPACARQHHLALGRPALDWREGSWVERPGGSGRELCWFPDPVGGRDCYRAALADALLLHDVFSDVGRLTARVAANRRNRLTARLPRLRGPHPEGGPGAIRVEVRGRRGGAYATEVYGAMDRPAVAAGAVAALAALSIAQGRAARAGASGLAGLFEPLPFLQELRERGVRAAVFEGFDGRSRSAA